MRSEVKQEIAIKGVQKEKEELTDHEYKGLGCNRPKKTPKKDEKMTRMIKWCNKIEESSRDWVIRRN